MEKNQKQQDSFRVYEFGTPVYFQYKAMRQNQTYQFAQNMRKRHLLSLQSSNNVFDVIEEIQKLDQFIDNSDPDISLSNINHLYQTAQRMRKDGMPEWFQLTGFIHDFGKVIGFLFNKDNEGTSLKTQWAIVGDIYVLGCKLRNSKVYPQLDSLSPDMQNPKYNTDLGIYTKNCGLLNCQITWSHDQFLYDVIKYNRKIGNVSSQYPQIAEYIIRHHSLYPWHSYGQYTQLEDEYDRKCKDQVKKFQKYDLYTKQNIAVNVNELRQYYLGLIKKFFKDGKLVLL